MYTMQDRVYHLDQILNHDVLLHKEIDMCRSHGHDKLCDGFICAKGSECQSGCCASFDPLTENYCQPLINQVCPVAGFIYGPDGKHFTLGLEDDQTELDKVDDIDPQKLAGEVAEKMKNPFKRSEGEDGKSSFSYPLIAGIIIVLIVIACMCCLYCCCCRSGSTAVDERQYNALN